MEEMEQKKQTTTRSYRVDEETAEKIAALGKELGINQNGVFEALLSAYELQQDAALIPDAAKDIETFISHLRSIQDAYHNIVSINAQTEERVRQEFQRRLENDDNIIAELRDIRDHQNQRISTLEEELAGMLKKITAKEQALTEAEQRITERDKSLVDKATIIDSLTARLPEQAETDEKIATMKKELAVLQAALTVAERERTEAIAKADKAELIYKQAQQEKVVAEKTHAKDLETAAKQAAADLKTAVAEAKEAERVKALDREEKLQEKIEGYRTKLDQQKDLIAELKAQIKK